MNMLAHYFSQLEGKIAVSKIEHSSSWLPWVVAEGHRSAGKRCAFMDDLECYNENVQALGRNQVIRYDLNDRNDFDLNSIESILSEQPVKAIVITASSNLTGYVPNIREISSLAHKYRAYVVVDGCQFIQHHRINMVECGIDFLIASGHKFYAPYGAGFIAGPKSFFDSFLPYQIGGGNLPYIDTSERFYRYQSERAHEPGTPNTVGAVSMAVALQELDSIGIEKIEAYESDLTRRAFLGIKDNPRVRVLVREDSLTTVLPFIILDMDPHMAARRLNDEYGIGVRAGTFCMFDSIRNLLGIQSDDDIVAELQAGRQSSIPGILRASFSIVNSYDDVDNFVMAVNQLAGSHCEVSTSGEDIYSGSINQPEAHAI
jgi:cysteine desulfurase